jgi:hypothetical protein
MVSTCRPAPLPARCRISLAVRPLSKAPISLDEVMNMEFTDDTRPFRWSGVQVLHQRRPHKHAHLVEHTAEEQKDKRQPEPSCDSAKPDDAQAEPGHAQQHDTTGIPPIGPVRQVKCHHNGAQRHGRPQYCPAPAGPTCKISLAYTGSSATAPPNSTANKSSAIAPRITWLPKHKAQPFPDAHECRFHLRSTCGTGFGRDLPSKISRAINQKSGTWPKRPGHAGKTVQQAAQYPGP